MEGLCEAARLAVEGSKFVFSEGATQVTVSLGAASYTADMTRLALLEAADAQLYRAKHRGRNQAAFAWKP